MVKLIGKDNKYYQLKENCPACKALYENEPDKVSICPKCKHLFYKKCFTCMEIESQEKSKIIKQGIREINFYSRKKECGFLSNFWRCKQAVYPSDSGNVWSYEYDTNEHFYQSMKAKDIEMKQWIKNAPTPYAAMKAGRSLRENEIVDDWERIKVKVMLTGLRAKFKNEELRQQLLDTGDAILHEDSPDDLYWGRRGLDMLGKLLMEVREEIRKEEGSEEEEKIEEIKQDDKNGNQ